MTIYLDSSVLVKLYVYEAKSKEVTELVENLGEAVLFTRLHELEMKNGIRTKGFRREIMTEQITQSLKLIDTDLSSGRLKQISLNWNDVYDYAESLSHKHSRQIGCRSLDILHVAAAMTLGIKKIITTDHRQEQLARAANFQVTVI